MPKVTKFKSTNELQQEVLMAHDVRFDPHDAKPVYIGLNHITDASDTAVSWIIYKFTYAGDNVTRIQKATGAWDDRASIF